MAILRGMPPNGFNAHAQQTPAAHLTHARFTNGTVSRGPRRARRAKAASAPRRAKKSSSYKANGQMRKGSAAAKAWGRKMARMRRR